MISSSSKVLCKHNFVSEWIGGRWDQKVPQGEKMKKVKKIFFLASISFGQATYIVISTYLEIESPVNQVIYHLSISRSEIGILWQTGMMKVKAAGVFLSDHRHLFVYRRQHSHWNPF